MDVYIKIDRVSFAYEDYGDRPDREPALSDISLEIKRGEHVAILGRNGSGKSTLARLINGLEIPGTGDIVLASYNTRDEEESWEVRRRCGMVFQNPDNQIVATTVEEDVAFGPENLGMPSEEIRLAVDRSLAYVGLSEYAHKAPTELSGGQKQKLAIAGILAMQPECIILDEATSMLDPEGRASFLELVLRLQKERQMTVINITHDMQEASMADKVVVLHKGRVLLDGTPAEIFHHVDEIRAIGLDVPAHTAIAKALYDEAGLDLPIGAAATAELAEESIRHAFEAKTIVTNQAPSLAAEGQDSIAVAPVVMAKNISYSYNAESYTPEEAIQDISFEIRRGEFFGVMGHSGSGKSTLIQHLNGLLRIQDGSLSVLDRDLRKVKDIRVLRRQVQVLFQYPEHQLFADTVRQDIYFGPQKLGVPADQIDMQVEEACRLAGVEESWMERSPFELSGGEKRRVALAGILAMKPDILILDEPAAGLDPAGREEIIAYLQELHSQGVTIVMVSHNMDDLARLSDRILVLNGGRRVMLGTVEDIFRQGEELHRNHLQFPAPKAFLERFKPDLPALETNCFTIEAATAMLAKHLRKRGGIA